MGVFNGTCGAGVGRRSRLRRLALDPRLADRSPEEGQVPGTPSAAPSAAGKRPRRWPMTRRIALATCVALAWLPLHAQDGHFFAPCRTRCGAAWQDLRLGDMQQPYFIGLPRCRGQERASRSRPRLRHEQPRGIVAPALCRTASRRCELRQYELLQPFLIRSVTRQASSGAPLSRTTMGNSGARFGWPPTARTSGPWISSRRSARALQNATRVDESPDFSAEEPHQHADDQAAR